MADVSTPTLAAAVSNASGLGSFGVGAKDAAGAISMIEATRARTDRAINVNLFVHAPVRRQIIWDSWRRKLAECRPHLGVDVKRRSCGVASADVRW